MLTLLVDCVGFSFSFSQWRCWGDFLSLFHKSSLNPSLLKYVHQASSIAVIVLSKHVALTPSFTLSSIRNAFAVSQDKLFHSPILHLPFNNI